MTTRNINALADAQALGWADARFTRLAANSVSLDGALRAIELRPLAFAGSASNSLIGASGGASATMYFQGGTGNFGLSSAGININSTSTLSFSVSSWAGTPDTILARDAANTLAQRNGANAQAFNLYNTYTDASNYERLAFKFSDSAGYIGVERGGTGAYGNLTIETQGSVIFMRRGAIIASLLNTSFYPWVGASLDLGRDIRPWRNIFLRPSASLTPNANGDLTIEATNNTTLTFKLKGDDAVVRSGTITLA